ncbi:DUF3363 domain-containing protein [Acetobacter aceti]|uniref:DUF3363 domain-containing protein n=1 Tax=Acetobacter aceti TaxID=435 RepID=UPI001F445AE7
MPFRQSGEGDPVTGTCRQRFNLASGRFAMIDEGLGFELAPWSPSLEKQWGGRCRASCVAMEGSTDHSLGNGSLDCEQIPCQFVA